MTAITDDLDTFEDPEPARRVIQFDGWGRYKLPDPETGKEISWTRVTTLAGALEDQYHLSRWGRRKVLEGIVVDKGLVSLAEQAFQIHGYDPQSTDGKKAVDEVADAAIDVAGAHKGADRGTMLHSVTEDQNQGNRDQALQRAAAEGVEGNLAAYNEALAKYRITVVPDFMERVICVPSLKVVGRLDNLVREMGLDLLRVFDLKSQKTMDFGAMKIAIQLAIYANGYAMFNEDTWEWEEMPLVDKELATVCHLPVLEGLEAKVCHMYDVDLAWGWRWARASFQTRKARNYKPVTRRQPPAFRGAATIPATAPEPARKAFTVPDQVHHPVSEEAVAALAEAAVVSSGPVKLVPTTALTEDPRALFQDIESARVQGVDWEARFRHAGTTQELTEIGRECQKVGALTDGLKEIGRKRRLEILEQINK